MTNTNINNKNKRNISCLYINKELRDKVKDIVKNNYKYRNYSHFVTVAIEELLKKERNSK